MSEPTDILNDATFSLHKWVSNVSELDEAGVDKDHEEQTAAKRQLGVMPTETKIMGTTWDKEKDTLSVQVGQNSESPTKLTILSRLMKIYDPLGVASPLLLQGKQIYREVCDLKLLWDTDLNGAIKRHWEKWEDMLPSKVEVYQGQSYPSRNQLRTWGFMGSETRVVRECVRRCTQSPGSSGVTQELLAAKARLAKKGLTIPRLELVASHMAAKLVINSSKALSHNPHETHCWSDSTVALWWIKGEGEYKQFVLNRVAKIQAADGIIWPHVPKSHNLADLGSRGGQLTDFWKKGLTWLPDRSQCEAKATREILNMGMEREESVILGSVLAKYPLRKTLRIGAWIKRFIDNCRRKKDERKHGQLTTEEEAEQRLWCIKEVQRKVKEDPKFQADLVQLNIKPDANEILKCHFTCLFTFLIIPSSL